MPEESGSAIVQSLQAIAERLATANVTSSSADSNDIDGGDTTSSVTYVALATAGPAVTVTIGDSGKALVTIGASFDNNSANFSLMSFDISGATVLAAADKRAVGLLNTNDMFMGRTFVIKGLYAGSTTFTAKYRVGGGTGTYVYRHIGVVPL